MAPHVSTVTAWKMKCRPIIAYLSIFLTATASATYPAASAARVMVKDTKVLTHVEFQMRQWPRELEYTVITSGRFPSPRSRPDG